MRPHDHLKPLAQQLVQQFSNAAVQNIIRLPRRRNQNLFSAVLRLVHLFVGSAHVLQNAVAHRNKLLLRRAVKRLALPDLSLLKISYHKDRVIKIQSALSKHHMSRQRIVEHIDIFHILSDKRAFDVVLPQIGHRHYHHIRIHLHHQRNQAVVVHIVRHNPSVGA